MLMKLMSRRADCLCHSEPSKFINIYNVPFIDFVRVCLLLLLTLIIFTATLHFCRAMLRKRGLCRHAVSVCVCLSLCLSFTFVHSVKTNKHIFRIFSPSGSHTILVFPYQMAWQYSGGNPPNRGVECRWVGRNRESQPISGCIVCCQCCELPGVINTVLPDRGKL